MNRREALRNVALLMGGTIISSQTFLTSCVFGDEQKAIVGDSSYSLHDIALMNEIGEIIIPATETPGAKAAQVGQFMIVMLRDCYEEKQQETFRNGLTAFQRNFSKEFDVPFEEASLENRNNFIRKLEEEMRLYYENKTPEQPEHYYRMLKELTLLGYFTSEIGSTQALNYIQTPGRYEACIPYKKGDKAWA